MSLNFPSEFPVPAILTRGLARLRRRRPAAPPTGRSVGVCTGSDFQKEFSKKKEKIQKSDFFHFSNAELSPDQFKDFWRD